ncbi:hypothetical protein T484DRAFT_1972455 [Baffinella frigidus]|nr:hypothetical protein T484DRAFT_1972455 [Cryptophyta sp. CCMP2293]
MTALAFLLSAAAKDFVGYQNTTQDAAAHFISDCLMVLAVHRWAEILFGTNPKGTDSSLWMWVTFIALPSTEVAIDADGKPVPFKGSKPNILAYRLARIARELALAVLFTNIFPHLPPGSAIEGWAVSVVLSAVLSLGEPGLMYINLSGFEPVPPMRHPCWLSQGVNDFWGRRWNVTVHRFLRRLYHAPVLARTGSRAVATAAAFAGSSILHEVLIWRISSYCDPSRKSSVLDSIGRQTLFFIIQGLTCWLERVGQLRFPGATKRIGGLPRAVQTALTVIAICPFSFLFIDPMRAGGLLVSLQHFFPRLPIVPPPSLPV